jgi:hypothetical protein
MPESMEKYWQLVADLEREVLRISACYRDLLKCGPGCCDCCRPFAVFPVEAQIIRSAIINSVGNSLEQAGGSEGFCSLLRNQRCTVYTHRPLICRTQGLPIGYIDHEQGLVEVSACELNFGGYDGQFAVEQLLMMDVFNDRLQEINAQFCTAEDIGPWQRIPIQEIRID